MDITLQNSLLPQSNFVLSNLSLPKLPGAFIQCSAPLKSLCSRRCFVKRYWVFLLLSRTSTHASKNQKIKIHSKSLKVGFAMDVPVCTCKILFQNRSLGRHYFKFQVLKKSSKKPSFYNFKQHVGIQYKNLTAFFNPGKYKKCSRPANRFWIEKKTILASLGNRPMREKVHFYVQHTLQNILSLQARPFRWVSKMYNPWENMFISFLFNIF